MTVTYQPQIWDVRSSDSPSVQNTLPLLSTDDWPILLNFMQSHWPEFDLIGDYGEDRADPGQRWWAIGAIEVKEGPAVFQIQYRKDADTYDRGNILSFCSWPGAPDLPSGFNPTVDAIYDTQAIYAFSAGADSTGYPHGSESGPYKFWLNSDPADWPDRRVGSDALVGVHWFETHVCCNAVFWPMRQGGTTPPPTGDSNYYLVQTENGVPLAHIRFVGGPPPVGMPDALALWQDGQPVGHVEWQPGAVPG